MEASTLFKHPEGSSFYRVIWPVGVIFRFLMGNAIHAGWGLNMSAQLDMGIAISLGFVCVVQIDCISLLIIISNCLEIVYRCNVLSWGVCDIVLLNVETQRGTPAKTCQGWLEALCITRTYMLLPNTVLK